MLTALVSPTRELISRLTARKNSKKLPGDFFQGGSRDDDAPARAGILASVEPEGEAAWLLS